MTISDIKNKINERIDLLNAGKYVEGLSDTQKYCAITGINIANFVTDIDLIEDNMIDYFYNLIPNGIGFNISDTTPTVSSEEEFIETIVNNDSVKLASNIEVTNRIKIDKDVKVNLNGKDIVCNTVTNGFSVLFDVTSGNLVIDGNGNIKTSAETDDDYSIAVWAHGGNAIINGGTFENKGNSTDLIYASGGGNIEIYGGEFIASGPTDLSLTTGTTNPYVALNVRDADYKSGISNIVVKGGKFHNFNPMNNVSESKNTNFVADGYTVIVNGVENTEPYTIDLGNVIYEVVKK